MRSERCELCIWVLFVPVVDEPAPAELRHVFKSSMPRYGGGQRFFCRPSVHMIIAFSSKKDVADGYAFRTCVKGGRMSLGHATQSPRRLICRERASSVIWPLDCAQMSLWSANNVDPKYICVDRCGNVDVRCLTRPTVRSTIPAF